MILWRPCANPAVGALSIEIFAKYQAVVDVVLVLDHDTLRIASRAAGVLEECHIISFKFSWRVSFLTDGRRCMPFEVVRPHEVTERVIPGEFQEAQIRSGREAELGSAILGNESEFFHALLGARTLELRRVNWHSNASASKQPKWAKTKSKPGG